MAVVFEELPDREAAINLFSALVEKRAAKPPHNRKLPVVLYGAGNLGTMAASVLLEQGVAITYAVDRSPPPDRLLLNDIQVLSPDEVPAEHYEDHLIAVCVVMAPYEEIYTQLQEQGWQNIVPFYDLADSFAGEIPLNNGWFSGTISSEDRTEIIKVMGQWWDAASRAAHIQFLAWRILREEWQFIDAPVTIDDRYFIPPVMEVLGKDESFLDAGAWKGSVSERFIELSDHHFNQIIAVEPDRTGALSFRAWLESLPEKLKGRIEVKEIALSDHCGHENFAHGQDMTSRLMESGRQKVETFSLDELKISFTFAKLHLEGGELNSLYGGLEQLKRNRPLLAVTTYHNRDGLWKIPRLLMRELANYRFLFRLHAWCGTGAVLYAIPTERITPIDA